MFNVNWEPINTNNLTIVQNPCYLDIVGSNSLPAMFIGFNENYVYFRLRIDCNPVDVDGNENKLFTNNVWGVIIKDTTGIPLYAVRVNTKQNDETVQVYLIDIDKGPFSGVPCEADIVYGDTGNVQVNLAPPPSNFNSTQDYFLDFKVALSCFQENFFDRDLIYCGFTSASDQVINKETPPPYGDMYELCEGEPTVEISKTVTTDGDRICASRPETYNIRIAVKNTTDQSIDITVDDEINPDFVITSQVPSPPPPPWADNIEPNETLYFEYVVTGYFSNPGSYQFNTATVSNTSTEEILGIALGPTIVVNDCRGLFFS